MRRWEVAVAAFARAANCAPPHPWNREPWPYEVGVVGLSGVGKSSLLNALIAPLQAPMPAGGIGPLTSVPVRIRYSGTATLRVRYAGGAPRCWTSDSPDPAFLRHVHDHVAGDRAALCEEIELGWPSRLLGAGVTLVDLPGLGVVGDAHAQHTRGWIERARAVLLVTDRAGLPDTVVASLRRAGVLRRVADGHVDLIGVMTKLDQVTDDARRANRAGGSWAAVFRTIVAHAESELLAQLEEVLRRDFGREAPCRTTECVFGVSSSEHQRLVQRDEESRPRLRVAESTGIPALGRSLAALSRLRSTPWASEILDRARTSPEAATLIPELMSLVEMEGRDEPQ